MDTYLFALPINLSSTDYVPWKAASGLVVGTAGTVTIDPPRVITPLYNINISGGTIASIVVLTAGYGFPAAPTLTITDPTGTGTGATATATTSSNGTVSAIVVTAPGSGYVQAKLTFAPSAGVLLTLPVGVFDIGFSKIYKTGTADGSLTALFR